MAAIVNASTVCVDSIRARHAARHDLDEGSGLQAMVIVLLPKQCAGSRGAPRLLPVNRDERVHAEGSTTRVDRRFAGFAVSMRHIGKATTATYGKASTATLSAPYAG